jgi:SSS family solute:Na+ symporter
VLVGTISSSLNALSTVFAMDVYARRINPHATDADVVRVGRRTVLVGCAFAVLMALAIDSVKGLNLFDVFQAVLGFIAPPLAVVFLLSVFWARTTQRAVNGVLSLGSAFSLGVGVVYLWVLPPDVYHFWPHYLMLSFYIFAALFGAAVLISLTDPAGQAARQAVDYGVLARPTRRVQLLWAALAVVMVGLYVVFNGH